MKRALLVHVLATLVATAALRLSADPVMPHPAKLPLQLQDHKAPVAFRNIWVRELQLSDRD